MRIALASDHAGFPLKEEIKGDSDLSAAFEGETAADVMRALDGSDRGRRFAEERIAEHAQARFSREADDTAPAAPARDGAPAVAATSERSAR